MTGPEHYQEAERMLTIAMDEGGNYSSAAMERAERFAQIHATLAQAAATAMAAYTDDGMTPEDWSAWNDVAGIEGASVTPA